MTFAELHMHYSAVFAAWVAAGGVHASTCGDAWAATLLMVLGDIDAMIVDREFVGGHA